MLRPVAHIRYHIAVILAAHWLQFVAQYKRWIRPVVFENVRKVLACRTPVLGCHIYQCKYDHYSGIPFHQPGREQSQSFQAQVFETTIIFLRNVILNLLNEIEN